MQIVLSKDLIQTLTSKMLTLEELAYMLGLHKEEEDWVDLPKDPRAKLSAFGYVSRSTNTLTAEGYALIAGLASIDMEFNDEEFEEFFAAYPLDDEHGNFPKTTGIRGPRNERLKQAFREARSKAVLADIIGGLNNYVKYLKSDRRGNALTYMKRPLRFLNEEIWKDFLKNKEAVVVEYGTSLA